MVIVNISFVFSPATNKAKRRFSRFQAVQVNRSNDVWPMQTTHYLMNLTDQQSVTVNDFVTPKTENVDHSLDNLYSKPNKFMVFTSCYGQKCKDYDPNFNSLRCYVKRNKDYGLMILDFNKPQPFELIEGCNGMEGKNQRHCIISNYLKTHPETKAVLHLDADCAIYDFERRFETYLINDSQMTFDIRFHNGEVMSGVYVVKNTQMSIDFLKSWSKLTGFLVRPNGDNGKLHRAILDWSGHKNDCLAPPNYGVFMRCFHKTIRESRCQHDFFRNVTVLYPTDAIEYDGWVIQYRFSDRTFIHHAMKNPFGGSGRLLPNPLLNDCVTPKTKGYHVTVQEEMQLLAKKDVESAKERLQRNGLEYPTCLVSRLPHSAVPDKTNLHNLDTHSSNVKKSDEVIINVGLPKSGTTSLHSFFKCGNISSSHHHCKKKYCEASSTLCRCSDCIKQNIEQNRDPFHACGNYTAWTQMDTDMTCYFPQISALELLHYYYPHSTFVLPIRESSAWVNSVMNWYNYPKHLMHCFKLDQDHLIPQLQKLYENHIQFVKKFAAEKKHKLVVFDITDMNTAVLLEKQFNIPKECWKHKNHNLNKRVKTSLPSFTVVISVSTGFDDMFRNWLYWYRKLRIDNTVVLIAEDMETFNKYQNCGFQVKLFDKTIDNHEPFSYNTNEYNALVSRRPAALLSVMQEFGNILYTDADVVWKASPFPYLIGDYDLWVQDDGKHENVCTGFMALKRSPVVEDILHAWDLNLKTKPTLNQPAFNDLLKKSSVKVYHLPADMFMNGKDYFEKGQIVDSTLIVTIHNNWIIGKDKKQTRFQEHDLWNPVPDLFCTQSNAKRTRNVQQRIIDLKFSKRDQLGDILNENKFEVGVEIGVQAAFFSETTLKRWKSCKIYVLVDPWQHQDHYHDGANTAQNVQDKTYNSAINRLRPFEEQGVKIIVCRNFSDICVNHFKDNYFDYIYVDARHDFKSVYKDMSIWWPKLKAGGIFAGHDYLTQDELRHGSDWTVNYDGTIDHTRTVVKGAVNKFAAEHNLKITQSREAFPSWATQK